MHRRCLIFTVALIALLIPATDSFADKSDTIPGPPPGTYRILSDDGMVRVPFEIVGGDICMACKVNGRECRMLLDNGFLWDPLLFFGSPTVDSFGLEYDGEAEVSGSGDGDPIPSRTASNITVTFPGVEFYDQTAIITPYSSGTSRMWWNGEGQISAAFFKHFVVEINFDDMIITLTEPDKFEYTGSGKEIPMIHMFSNSWGIPAAFEMSDGQTISSELTMDLGYGDWLQLVPGGPHKFSIPEKALPASLGYGVQGETRGYFGRVQSVEIAGYKIDNVLTAFVGPDCAETVFHESLLGLALLAHFNFVYDYQNQRMFVEPNKNFNQPSEYDMTGMVMRKGGEDFLNIKKIHPNSAASEAGLIEGDKVIMIDGRPATSYTVWDLRPLLQRDGETVVLIVERDNEQMEVPLKLRRLL